MGQQRRPPAYQPLEPAYQALRDLIRQRRALVKILVSENNRLSEAPDSKAVRAVLYLAALTACRSNHHRLARVYHHLIDDNHLCKREALVALMRKTLVIGRALLIHNRPYDDNFAEQTCSAS